MGLSESVRTIRRFSDGETPSPNGRGLLAYFRDRDLPLRPLGNTIYVMPLYCIETRELDLIYDAIEEAIEIF